MFDDMLVVQTNVDFLLDVIDFFYDSNTTSFIDDFINYSYHTHNDDYNILIFNVLYEHNLCVNLDMLNIDSVPFTVHLTSDVQEFATGQNDKNGNLLFNYEFDVIESL